MQEKRFSFKVLLSLVNTYTFLVLAFSGIILVLFGKGLKAIDIQIRVLGPFSTFMGLNSGEWFNIHIIFGLFFIITTILHFIVHVRVFTAYLKGISRVKLMRRAVSIMASVLFLTAAGTALIGYFDDSGQGGNGTGSGYGQYVNNDINIDENLLLSPERGVAMAAQGDAITLVKGQGSGKGLRNGQGGGNGRGDGSGQGNENKAKRRANSLIHTFSAVLLLCVSILHFYYNWKPFKAYFTARNGSKRRFARELMISALLVILLIVGTVTDIQPFTALLR